MHIYRISQKDIKGKPRQENDLLVRAESKTAALRFVAEKTLDVALATQDELVRLVVDGVKVEESKPE